MYPLRSSINILAQLYEYYRLRKNGSPFLCCVSFRTRNWGDALNKELVQAITGREIHIIHAFYLERLSFIRRIYTNEPIFTFIGSVMGFAPASAVVWGTGSVWYEDRPRSKSTKILAVRGPLTRNVLLKYGFECPEVYGDPALLLARHFPEIKARTDKRFKLGIIPHLFEWTLPTVEAFRSSDDVSVINITLGFRQFIDRVRECECIASSSLHGLVLADVLEIPNVWIKLSNLIHGGEFKYRDYYASLSRSHKDYDPLYVSQNTRIKDLIAECSVKEVHVDLDMLEDALLGYLKQHV